MRPFRLALAALALTGCARNMPALTAATPLAASSSALESEEPAGPLRFTVKRYPGGEPHAIADDRGSVVLLDVWATWCEPCRDALPVYEQLARHYAARGLKVYALNVDEDTRAIPKFLADTKVTSLPVLLDANAEVSDKVLKVRGMPTTVLIDRQGRVRYMHEGFSEEFLARYQAEIEELLAEPGKK
jgi:thiol-disulfide isomerase/thioredoxin